MYNHPICAIYHLYTTYMLPTAYHLSWEPETIIDMRKFTYCDVYKDVCIYIYQTFFSDGVHQHPWLVRCAQTSSTEHEMSPFNTFHCWEISSFFVETPCFWHRFRKKQGKSWEGWNAFCILAGNTCFSFLFFNRRWVCRWRYQFLSSFSMLEWDP